MNPTVLKKEISSYFAKPSCKHISSSGVFDIPSNSTIYVLGDLEGKIDVLYHFFFDITKLIAYNLKKNKHEWTGPPNTFIVQCGDQIDRNPRRDLDIDLATMMFLDWACYISKGKVISIVGNHELLNIQGVYEADSKLISNCNREDFISCNHRKELFQKNKLIGKIIKRRYIAAILGNTIYSHAGVTTEMFDRQTDIKDFVAKTNKSLLRRGRIFSIKHESPIGITDTSDPQYMFWHRRFGWKSSPKVPMQLIPKGYVSIIGHNGNGESTVMKALSSSKGEWESLEYNKEYHRHSIVMCDVLRNVYSATSLLDVRFLKLSYGDNGKLAYSPMSISCDANKVQGVELTKLRMLFANIVKQ